MLNYERVSLAQVLVLSNHILLLDTVFALQRLLLDEFFHEGGIVQREAGSISWGVKSTKDFGNGKLGSCRPCDPRLEGILATQLGNSLVQ